jgi:hypothetical protein
VLIIGTENERTSFLKCRRREEKETEVPPLKPYRIK